MKYFITFIATILCIMSSAQIVYPKTEKGNVSDDFFGKKVKDDYRWLEDDLSEKTKKWVEQQNQVTFNFLNKISYKAKLKQELKDIYNYEKISAPFKEGKYTYFYKNDGLQAQSVLYQQLENNEPKVFLNPNNFSKDGTTSLAGINFSDDGSLAAYQISEGGSDWRKVIIMNASDKKIIEDTLVDVKFSGIAWYKNQGFFYSSYDKPKGSELSNKTSAHKLYYHRLGTSQKEDKLIFGGEKEEKRYVGGSITEDNRYLFISASQSTSGNELYYIDLNGNWAEIKTIVATDDADYEVIDNDGEIIFLYTNFNAPNGRLVMFDILKPERENWANVIKETDNALNVTSAGKTFFASYLKDATKVVIQTQRDGTPIREIEFPAKGSAGGFSGKQTDKEIYYSFTNYVYPTTIFKLNVENGESTLYRKPNVKFTPEDFVSEQVFYKSKDGTKIPMMITYHKNTKFNGKNPTILYGYGGFNISLTPSFSVFAATFMQNGGIYAVANLRGGGEYGKNWHDAGTKLQKKNVFNDFIAAGEFLIRNKYTSSEYLALSGGSNGGLLVGATMTMRPDLAKVALPAVGVLDMLRYHQFTAGKGWAYDYGTAEDNKEMFEYLYSYSPVHNVKAGVCYPATLITTGDHDDRVVPAHSYKFAVELQEKQSCNNPVLIRIETKAGHGAGKSTEQVLEEWADKMAFTFYAMGIKELK